MSKVLPGDEKLLETNRELQSRETVRLSAKHKEVVCDAIMKQGTVLGQKILALAVCSNHVHIVAEYIAKPVGDVVAIYKTAGRKVLNELRISGKVWTTGYDKRFCFDKESLEQRMRYVQNHDRQEYLAPAFSRGC